MPLFQSPASPARLAWVSSVEPPVGISNKRLSGDSAFSVAFLMGLVQARALVICAPFSPSQHLFFMSRFSTLMAEVFAPSRSCTVFRERRLLRMTTVLSVGLE